MFFLFSIIPKIDFYFSLFRHQKFSLGRQCFLILYSLWVYLLCGALLFHVQELSNLLWKERNYIKIFPRIFASHFCHIWINSCELLSSNCFWFYQSSMLHYYSIISYFVPIWPLFTTYFLFLDCIEIAAAFLQHATFCCPLEQLDERDIQETQVISLKQKGWKNRLLGAVYLQYYNTNKKNTTYSKENVKSITGKKSYGTFCFKNILF